MTDEAKEIVEALRKSACNGCIHNKIGRCMHIQQGKFCGSERHAAADLIEKLSAELEQVKRERNAAIADMEEMQGCICQACKHYYQPNPNVRKWSCRVLGEYWADICDHDGGLLECSNFEWRGVQEDA